jgi:pimeloyl-ACP methyl ester carboxylesterase
MKSFLAAAILVLTATFVEAGDIIKFTLFDGENVEGKLSLPTDAGALKELVIFVHGTGPATYDNHRKFGQLEFNYFDYFADEFNRRGIAFFTYNKRGVTRGDTPPSFEKIDRERYRKVLPSVEVRDIATFIHTLRRDKRLKSAKIVLLGWSEGTALASLVAQDKSNRISALFLNGYLNDNLADVIRWQNNGGSSMVNLRAAFDTDKDGAISRTEYESTEKGPAAFRTGAMQNTKFDQLDLDKDANITTADFATLLKPRYDAIFAAIDRGDDDWIWNNYFHVSTGWLKEHFALEANKDRMLRLKLPIYIFHGLSDANTPVEGVYDIRKRFDQAGKKNLHEYIFAGHNHDLNFVDWVREKKMPQGIRKMFEIAETLNK